jgi:hypothetical protein
MTKELLPCPFCGSSATMEQTDDNRWSVGCDSADELMCMGNQSFATFSRQVEARDAWNKRTFTEPQTAQAGDWINEPLRNWAATPAPLINGAVYDLSDFGPGEYIGIDVFHGETTHKFKTSDGLRYIKPERLAAALSRPHQRGGEV